MLPLCSNNVTTFWYFGKMWFHQLAAMQEICKSCDWKGGIYLLESTSETKEATTREARATSETPGEVVPTIEIVDPVDKGLPVEKSVEQPIDKINISAFVSDFNSDSPDSSSEVRKIFLSSMRRGLRNGLVVIHHLILVVIQSFNLSYNSSFNLSCNSFFDLSYNSSFNIESF